MASTETRFFITPNVEWLLAANTRGINPANATKEWVTVLIHPDGQSACAKVPESFVPRLKEFLSVEELAVVNSGWKTEEEARAAGFDV